MIRKRRMKRAPLSERVRMTVEIDIEQYSRLLRFLEQFGVVRNRFMIDAIDQRLAHLNPSFARPEGKNGGLTAL